MADETLSWEMKLFDHMSGALGSAERHLDSLLKSLGITSKGMDKFSSSAKSAAAASRGVGVSNGALSGGRFDALKRFGDRLFGGRHDANFIGPRELPGRQWTRGRQRLASNLFGDGAEERVNRRYKAIAKNIFGDDNDKNVDRIKSGFEKIGSAGAMAAKALAATAAAMGAAAAAMAVAGGKWMIETISFKENSMATFETMLGSEDAASRVFKQASKFAAETPFSSQEVISGFQRFLTAGFQEDELDKLMRAVGDVGASMGTEKMQSVMIAMGQIKAKGKLQSEELMQLADAGIGQLSVKEALQRTSGKSREQVDKMITGGKITGDQGIEAILEAIRVSLSGGELGGNMQRKSKTLDGLFSSMMDIPTTLLNSSDADKATEPLKETMRSIIKMFDEGEPMFKKGVAMFDRISKAWSEAFGKAGKIDFPGLLGGAMDSIASFGEKAAPLFSGFFVEITKQLSDVFGSDGKIDKKDLEAKGVALAKLLGIFIKGTDLAIAVFTKWADIFVKYWSDVGEGAAKMFGGVDVFDPDEAKLREYDEQARMYRDIRVGRDRPLEASKSITTTVGQIVVQVQPGQEGAGVAIATDVQAQLPNQMANYALEHGG